MGSPGNSVNSFNSATAGSTGVSAIVCTRRFTRREGGGVKEREGEEFAQTRSGCATGGCGGRSHGVSMVCVGELLWGSVEAGGGVLEGLSSRLMPHSTPSSTTTTALAALLVLNAPLLLLVSSVVVMTVVPLVLLLLTLLVLPTLAAIAAGVVILRYVIPVPRVRERESASWWHRREKHGTPGSYAL
jgi:hypothetical protein